jgi:hypothetical protein
MKQLADSSQTRLSTIAGERRVTRRHRLELPLRYQSSGKDSKFSGSGVTVDISSTGILFRPEAAIPVGTLIDLQVDWPVALGGVCELELCVKGEVVREVDALAGIRMLRYEFRTRGTHAFHDGGEASHGWSITA